MVLCSRMVCIDRLCSSTSSGCSAGPHRRRARVRLQNVGHRGRPGGVRLPVGDPREIPQRRRLHPALGRGRCDRPDRARRCLPDCNCARTRLRQGVPRDEPVVRSLGRADPDHLDRMCRLARTDGRRHRLVAGIGPGSLRLGARHSALRRCSPRPSGCVSRPSFIHKICWPSGSRSVLWHPPAVNDGLGSAFSSLWRSSPSSSHCWSPRPFCCWRPAAEDPLRGCGAGHRVGRGPPSRSAHVGSRSARGRAGDGGQLRSQRRRCWARCILHGVSCVLLERVAPIAISLILSWWVSRRLGPAALEPVPLMSRRRCLARSSARLRAELVRLLLHGLDGSSGPPGRRARVTSKIGGRLAGCGELGLMCVPGFELRVRPWGRFDRGVRPSPLLAAPRRWCSLRLLRGSNRRNLWPWLGVVAFDLFTWPAEVDSLHHRQVSWFWQIVLVVPGFVLAARPLLAELRPRDATSRSGRFIETVTMAG